MARGGEERSLRNGHDGYVSNSGNPYGSRCGATYVETLIAWLWGAMQHPNGRVDKAAWSSSTIVLR